MTRPPVWSDEFDEPAGSPPSPARWRHELGGGGWGDDQQQHYTDRTANASVTAEGHLALTARREPDGTITSARLTSRGLATPYGRVEARIRVPAGRGLWPAFWMLGTQVERVGWPACGEIDVMEHVGSEPRTVHGTAHGPGFAGVGRGRGGSHDLSVDLADDFHVFAVRHAPDRVEWAVDGTTYHCLTVRDVPAGGWVFSPPFFLLLNLAVGGSWPGNDSVDPPLPATLLVDWVRVHAAD